MKRNLTQQVVAVAVLALVLGAGASQAAVFSYNSGTNWYTDWTATGEAGWLVVNTSDTSQIQVYNTNGNTSVPGNHWAGAQWTAPAGQIITHVDLGYWGVINAEGAATLTVYAGTTAATATEVFVNAATLVGQGSSTSLTFSPTSQYAFLQVRNWDGRGVNYSIATYPWWQSDLTAATITTSPIPEPVGLSLLALGGCWLLRRRRD